MELFKKQHVWIYKNECLLKVNKQRKNFFIIGQFYLPIIMNGLKFCFLTTIWSKTVLSRWKKTIRFKKTRYFKGYKSFDLFSKRREYTNSSIVFTGSAISFFKEGKCNRTFKIQRKRTRLEATIKNVSQYWSQGFHWIFYNLDRNLNDTMRAACVSLSRLIAVKTSHSENFLKEKTSDLSVPVLL